MTKHGWNFIIDGLMFLCMAAIAGLGLFIKYTMPPGRIARATYGSGTDLSFLGMDRHDWGTIHLYVGIALLVLLVLHIVLHWGLIKALFKKTFKSAAARWVVGTVFVALAVFLLALPVLFKPSVVEGGGQHEGWNRESRIEMDGSRDERLEHRREGRERRQQRRDNRQ